MSLIEIRPPRSVEEYQQACKMVERVYREAGYINAAQALPAPKAVVLAVKNGEIIGSVGLQASNQGTLPTEEAFGEDHFTKLKVEARVVFEWVRLAVTDRADMKALQAITAGTLSYVQTFDRNACWLFTVKPNLNRALRRFCHLGIFVLSGRLDSCVAKSYPGYYLTYPMPLPVTVSCQSAATAVVRLQQELSGTVRFNLSDFDHRLDYGCEETYHRRNTVERIAC